MSDIEHDEPEINDPESGDENVDDVVSDVEDGNDMSDDDGGHGDGGDEEVDESDLEENEEEDEEEGGEDVPGGNGGMLLSEMFGGAPDDEESEEGAGGEIHEDVLGERNKKIVHHDDILLLHPESRFHNYDEIYAASLVTRNENNIIVDKLHTTIPILTKYERAKVLGQRTKQLNAGNKPFVAVDRMTIDNSIIAEKELLEKKLPFIIQRPMPGGGVEYWHVKDLEVLA